LRYLFEEFALDTDRRELHRGADAVAIAPQVFDLLDYLIRNRQRVVSKDDLITAIWNGRVVSDAALTTRLNIARGVLGDTGSEQRLDPAAQGLPFCRSRGGSAGARSLRRCRRRTFESRPYTARQTLYRSTAVSEHEWRPRAGILR
jgi:hypothetical protein